MGDIDQKNYQPKSDQTKGLLYDIQRYSIHDGPGIRTIVFLKQCPLQCPWCCNPESQSGEFEIALYQKKCILCKLCVIVCPTGAISVDEDEVVIDRNICIKCGKCCEVCHSGALRKVGYELSVDETINEVMKDRHFYKKSGGGVTISGGEPLMQIDFLVAFLKECKKHGLHTAIETTGYAQWPDFKRILPYLDLVLLDIKQMNERKHIEFTGVSNLLILKNAEELAKLNNPDLVLRVPLIPGYNDSEEEIRAIYQFALKINSIKIDLLPYHRLGESKYENIGKEYSLENMVTDDDYLNKYVTLGKELGLDVKING